MTRSHAPRLAAVAAISVALAMGTTACSTGTPLDNIVEGLVLGLTSLVPQFNIGPVAVGNSLLAMSLLLAMIRLGEVSRVSALFYLVPAFSALFAWPILGEAMPPLAWLGMALAGAGVAMASKRKAQP